MKPKLTPFALAATAALVLAVAASACGSSGNSPGGGGNGGSGGLGGASGGGTLRWKDGGTQHMALFAAGARVISTMDMVQITGSDSAGAAVSFAVSLNPPPLVPGSYACSDSGTNGRIVTIAYSAGSASSLAPTCAVSITTIGNTTGTRVSGTFSATVPFDDGTTRTITDGVYDVPLTVSSL